nr:immunoglobulin heavy chain junction region [Mus musculus]MBK4188485.1 immunoglobulin heavy chain junction region [Mus musculus]MBK4188486.1 immunoglobulin heavy chain junction region [Mus musculus]MBK4196256.1 immunoglobulin heavy chain junction region [Mus musculus]MBK4198253.1 immunoglobulin heavy chain junction region [Mus musculus]
CARGGDYDYFDYW